MVSRAEKLTVRLHETARGWNSEELHTVLESAGFVAREGKHTVFKHPVHHDLGSYPIPRGKDLAPAYARKVLRLIECVHEREALKEGQDGE